MNRMISTLCLFALIAAAGYGLNHGIYVGSDTWREGDFIHRNCRYLFVSGISTLSARGGIFGLEKATGRVQKIPPVKDNREPGSATKEPQEWWSNSPVGGLSAVPPFDPSKQFEVIESDEDVGLGPPPKTRSLYCRLFAD
jgi:hypothetical protein